VQPAVTIDSFAVRRSGPEAKGVHRLDDWQAAEIPPGFRLTVPEARVAPDAGRGLRHLVYSDGLATVSLFIEPAVAASEQAEGLSQIGAANAYTTTMGGHMVTAVGEVPARTVEIFALSARPLKSGD
jgi:sigma-E factor negative regulatory protein RseB